MKEIGIMTKSTAKAFTPIYQLMKNTKANGHRVLKKGLANIILLMEMSMKETGLRIIKAGPELYFILQEHSLLENGETIK